MMRVHRRLELAALLVEDATLNGARKIWLGVPHGNGLKGCWLTPEKFREHVAALATFAAGPDAEGKTE